MDVRAHDHFYDHFAALELGVRFEVRFDVSVGPQPGSAGPVDTKNGSDNSANAADQADVNNGGTIVNDIQTTQATGTAAVDDAKKGLEEHNAAEGEQDSKTDQSLDGIAADGFVSTADSGVVADLSAADDNGTEIKADDGETVRGVARDNTEESLGAFDDAENALSDASSSTDRQNAYGLGVTARGDLDTQIKLEEVKRDTATKEKDQTVTEVTAAVTTLLADPAVSASLPQFAGKKPEEIRALINGASNEQLTALAAAAEQVPATGLPEPVTAARTVVINGVPVIIADNTAIGDANTAIPNLVTKRNDVDSRLTAIRTDVENGPVEHRGALAGFAVPELMSGHNTLDTNAELVAHNTQLAAGQIPAQNSAAGAGSVSEQPAFPGGPSGPITDATTGQLGANGVPVQGLDVINSGANAGALGFEVKNDGDYLWTQASDHLTKTLGREPTNQEIVDLLNVVARDNGTTLDGLSSVNVGDTFRLNGVTSTVQNLESQNTALNGSLVGPGVMWRRDATLQQRLDYWKQNPDIVQQSYATMPADDRKEFEAFYASLQAAGYRDLPKLETGVPVHTDQPTYQVSSNADGVVMSTFDASATDQIAPVQLDTGIRVTSRTENNGPGSGSIHELTIFSDDEGDSFEHDPIRINPDKTTSNPDGTTTYVGVDGTTYTLHRRSSAAPDDQNPFELIIREGTTTRKVDLINPGS